MRLELAKARKVIGITQEELAHEMGVSVQTLSKYENNPGEMKVAQAQRIAEILGFSFDGVCFVSPTEGE